MSTTTQYDFSVQLVHRRTQRPLTTNSIGLGHVAGLWNDNEAYAQGISVGTMFELLLLYTVDLPTQRRTPPHNVLSEQDKRERGRLAARLGVNSRLELSKSESDLLRKAISVLPPEPYVLAEDFLDNPS